MTMRTRRQMLQDSMFAAAAAVAASSGHAILAADKHGRSQTFVDETHGGAQHLLFFAFRKDDAFGMPPHAFVNRLHQPGDRIAPRRQFGAIAFHIDDRATRDARFHRRARDGQGPAVYIGDATQGQTRIRTLSEQVALETRTRMLNPKWAEGMLGHGYEGVRQIESHLTNTVGWSATTSQVASMISRLNASMASGAGNACRCTGTLPGSASSPTQSKLPFRAAAAFSR